MHQHFVFQSEHPQGKGSVDLQAVLRHAKWELERGFEVQIHFHRSGDDCNERCYYPTLEQFDD